MKEDLKAIIISIIIPIFMFIMIDTFFCGYNFNIWITLISTSGMILSIIILYSMFVILVGVCKKTCSATIVMAIFLVAFCIINQIKIIYTDEPITMADILYLGNSEEIVGIIDGTLMQTVKKYFFPTGIYVVISAILCIYSVKYNVEIKSLKSRASCVLIPSIVLIALFLPNSKTKELYLNIFDMDNRKDYDCSTTNIYDYAINGIVGGMYIQLLESRMEKPNGYNEGEVYDILETSKDDENSFKKPDIIVVFSESFWDVDQLDEVKFNKRVTSNFNRLKDKGIFIDMISPSYGGISANVEFEFLTGANLIYFNKGYVPYMQLYRNNSYYGRPSVISELNDNDYKTKIVTYTSNKLFNCGRVYNYFGVDETEFNQGVEEKYIKGNRASDEYVTQKIMDEFNNKKSDERLFYMALTMQGHMPYAYEKYKEYDIKINSSVLSEELNNVLLSYAQGVYDADKQLGVLYDYIQGLSEPTILVFFGDHLPYLKATNEENAIDKLEYFNTDDELINLYRKYNTQALILANYNLENDGTKILSPDLLSTYILNKMDIKISNYYSWLYSTKDILPSSNYFITIDNQGNLYNTNNLEGDLREMYELRKKVQYKYFID